MRVFEIFTLGFRLRKPQDKPLLWWWDQDGDRRFHSAEFSRGFNSALREALTLLENEGWEILSVIPTAYEELRHIPEESEVSEVCIICKKNK